MEMIRFIKKLWLQRKIKLDNKFQYVETSTFLWNIRTKKVLINANDKMSEFEFKLLQFIGEDNSDIERKNVYDIALDKDFTYKDFVKVYNYHYIVFYLYGNSIFHPTNPNDDVFNRYIWGGPNSILGNPTYQKNNKRIRVYIEEDLKQKRKLKLQKINI